jgi:glycosyltransferase involved in cell wall biosynthesis
LFIGRSRTFFRTVWASAWWDGGLKMNEGRIKVLFAIGTLDLGGAERQLVELATGLDRTRFHPIICVLAEGGPLEPMLRGAGVEVRCLGFKGFRTGSRLHVFSAARMLFRLWRIMSQERPAIFHGFLFWAYMTGTVVARIARVPTVIASRRSLGFFKAGKWHYLFAERLVNRMTDLFIANSEAVREDVIAQERVPPGRIMVIYNGVDTTRYGGPDDGAVRKELRVVSGPLVAVVSNFIEYKGHAFFFEAWEALVRRYPSAVAVLVGEGPGRAKWEERARVRGYANSIRFVGSRGDVARILASADLFVHPSLQEGCSNAVLEAMASSVPIVATAVGGNVEAIQDGVTGLLVPARDSKALEAAMARLLDDRDYARRLGTAARKAVEARHTVQRMVCAYEDVYERLAAGGGSGNSDVWDRRAV